MTGAQLSEMIEETAEKLPEMERKVYLAFVEWIFSVETRLYNLENPEEY